MLQQILPRTEIRLALPSRHKDQIKIRLATAVDAPRIRSLYFDAYQGKYPLSIIYDRHETVDSLAKPNYFWFVGESAGKMISSLIFCVDREVELAKVFGAVVHPEWRGLGITLRTLAYGTRLILDELKLAQSIYATTRTVFFAPQKLIFKLGFKELGVFPNVRKVQNYETHCLAALFREGALKSRMRRPRLPALLKPFYSIVQQAVGLGDAEWHDLPMAPESPYAANRPEFEAIEAQDFILSRWRHLKAQKKLNMEFFPFHEPNLLLAQKDQSTELYLFHSKLDHHAVLVGSAGSGKNLTQLLNAMGLFLEERGVRYLELLTDAYHPRVIQEILDARFIPSAYYPAMRWKHGKGRDYIIFSKSYIVLDFKNIVVHGLFRNYLKEYFRLWKSFYIDGVFEEGLE